MLVFFFQKIFKSSFCIKFLIFFLYSNLGIVCISSSVIFNPITMSWESHGFSCLLSEPPEEVRKPQPWPAVFTFPSRGQGWLEQILFVQSWSTHPAVVASIQLLNGSILCSLLIWNNFHFRCIVPKKQDYQENIGKGWLSKNVSASKLWKALNPKHVKLRSWNFTYLFIWSDKLIGEVSASQLFTFWI